MTDKAHELLLRLLLCHKCNALALVVVCAILCLGFVMYDLYKFLSRSMQDRPVSPKPRRHVARYHTTTTTTYVVLLRYPALREQRTNHRRGDAGLDNGNRHNFAHEPAFNANVRSAKGRVARISSA